MKMDFQSIPSVEKPETYIKSALAEATTRVDRLTRNKQKRDYSIFYYRRVERARIDVIAKVIEQKLVAVVKSFPEISKLPFFYKELVRSTIDEGVLKTAFGSLLGILKKVRGLHYEYIRIITRAGKVSDFVRIRKAFVGRLGSLLSKIESSLERLDNARKVMRTYPIIKDMPTIAIVGFPNVGKTTLLSKLSASKPKIANYSFTTTGINVGYLVEGSMEIQLLDTPGTLARPETMNDVEKQAYIAIKHAADAVVYVFDPTEHYPLEKQEEMLALVLKEKKPMLFYISKTDIAGNTETASMIVREHPEVIADVSELRNRVVALGRKFVKKMVFRAFDW